MALNKVVRVQSNPFDMAAEIEKLHNGNKAIGGVVAFSGWCRDENGMLSALEIEHFPGMAEKQIEAVVNQAIKRWPLLGVTIIHRFGHIKVGDEIVLVITASSHRQTAFDAANFIMDFLKTDAPFWKKEHLKNGETHDWVNAKSEDELQKKRW